jgi:hypothetical protein
MEHTNGNPVSEAEKLRAMLAAKEAELEALRAKTARKLTPEQEEARRKREEWEAIEQAEPFTPQAFVQGMPRLTQIDAFPKAVRLLPHRLVADLLVGICERAAEANNRSLADVLGEVTHRTPKSTAGIERIGPTLGGLAQDSAYDDEGPEPERIVLMEDGPDAAEGPEGESPEEQGDEGEVPSTDGTPPGQEAVIEAAPLSKSQAKRLRKQTAGV